MQGLNKRFYNTFVPSLVKSVQLYSMGNVSCGLVVFPGQDYLNILEATATDESLCEWKKVPFELAPTLSKQKRPMIQEREDGEESDDDASDDAAESNEEEEKNGQPANE